MFCLWECIFSLSFLCRGSADSVSADPDDAPLHDLPRDLLPSQQIQVRMLNSTKRCRLSWLTNSTLVYEPKCGGKGVNCGASANEYSCAQGAQLNFGDMTAYLIYGSFSPLNGVLHSLVKHMICLFGCKEKVKNESFCGTVLLF
jgi:hypothetical protein